MARLFPHAGVPALFAPSGSSCGCLAWVGLFWLGFFFYYSEWEEQR